MDTLLVALRLLLAAVFATAGVGKLLDRSGSRTALADFGVPQPLLSSGAVVLPLCELAVAIALLLKPLAAFGALGGLLLLLAFMTGIGVALRQGRAPECHCFGQLHSEPAGKDTLLRNAGLAALAAIVAAAGPGPSLDGWVRARSASELAASVSVVAAAVAVALLLARAYRVRALRARRQSEQPPGLPHAAPAPDFDRAKLCGCPGRLDVLTASGLPLLLIFAHPACVPCAELLPQVGRWQTTLAQKLVIAVVSQGDWDVNMATAVEHQIYNVVIESDTEIYDAYRIRGTPSAVVVSPDQRIASVTAQGPVAIEHLIRLTLRGRYSRSERRAA